MQTVEKILANKEGLLQTFKTYDLENNRLIKVTRFLRILERECFDINDKFFQSLFAVNILS